MDDKDFLVIVLGFGFLGLIAFLAFLRSHPQTAYVTVPNSTMVEIPPSLRR